MNAKLENAITMVIAELFWGHGCSKGELQELIDERFIPLLDEDTSDADMDELNLFTLHLLSAYDKEHGEYDDDDDDEE